MHIAFKVLLAIIGIIASFIIVSYLFNFISPLASAAYVVGVVSLIIYYFTKKSKK
jgi:hypothetical protein